jgi:putative transferase (TIGR04331 family)
MFLVTTADETTWDRDAETLFLGGWCTRYSRRHVWEHMRYEMAAYHWDDRARLHQDHGLLNEVYERHLTWLADALNDLHRCHHSPRYWRIVVGPWLRYFIGVLYDRYQSISLARDSGCITGSWVLRSDKWSWTPRDFDEFECRLNLDSWNHFVYGELMKASPGIPFKEIPAANDPPPDRGQGRRGWRSLSRSFAARYSSAIGARRSRVALITSYLPPLDLARLQLSLGQLPYLAPPSVSSPLPHPDPALRGFTSALKVETEFDEVLRQVLAAQIPTTYIEGYAQHREHALRTYPKKARVIYTANAQAGNDAFKLWAAERVEDGAELIIGQHGGQYGVGLWGQDEDHEIAIADRFFSWGWTCAENPKVKPMPVVKLNAGLKRVKPNRSGPVLWVQGALPRYSYCMYSVPVASQFEIYLDEQLSFARSLPPDIRDHLRIRSYQYDYGWDTEDRFRDAGLGPNISESSETISAALRRCRLCVSTYNATTYLETLSANYPTLLFWNPLFWEVRPEAHSWFEELRSVGILHNTPESAAEKLTEVFDVTEEWWRDPAVQAIRTAFSQEFALTSAQWMREWRGELLRSNARRSVGANT